MYKQLTEPESMKSASCSECKSTSLLYSKGKITCRNCGFLIGSGGFNKYGAKKTKAKDGMVRDSKYEASVADELLLRKQAGDIKDYESQYKVICEAYDKEGKLAFVVKHKVDFRIHHHDGSYELYEAKGKETGDYIFRRRCLETLWLPMHKDHTYTVVKQNARRK